MRSVTFPYRLLQGKYPAPIIPLHIQGKRGWSDTLAYVDSGASFSIFGPMEARRLGIQLTGPNPSLITVGDGGQIPVYLKRLPVRLGPFEWKAIIGFSPRLGVGFNLIDRKDFFQHFDVTFRESKRLIRFQLVH